jgi:hypothetical protein
MRVALVCIAKNEDNYIQEWIEYNLKLGFNQIFIYMNNWRTNIEHPQVTKIEFDGSNQQRNAYLNFTTHHKHDYDWAAFFDVDEFLVLKKHKTIQEFVSDYQNHLGIGINWYMFGNNGHTEVVNNEYSLIKRFTKRSSVMNEHVKTILNCKNNVTMDVHNPYNGRITSPNRVLFQGPFNTNTNDEIAQLNHYYCKTKEEFIEKCNRGRADSTLYTNTYEINYPPFNQNDVEDLWAYNFMYGEN